MPSATASDTGHNFRLQHKRIMSRASNSCSPAAAAAQKHKQQQQRGGGGGSQSPTTTTNRETTPESLVDADQKTKKRIQNRVAQRTYRNRMKQRVQDLEAQLCEMRARQQHQHQQHQHQQQQYFHHEISGNMTTEAPLYFIQNTTGLNPATAALWQQNVTSSSLSLPRTPGSLPQEMWPGMGSSLDGSVAAQQQQQQVIHENNHYITQSFPQTTIAATSYTNGNNENNTSNNNNNDNSSTAALLGTVNIGGGGCSGLQQVPSVAMSSAAGLGMSEEHGMSRFYRTGSAGSTPNHESMPLDGQFDYRRAVAALGQASEISEEEGAEANKVFSTVASTAWESSPGLMSPISTNSSSTNTTNNSRGTVMGPSGLSASPWSSSLGTTTTTTTMKTEMSPSSEAELPYRHDNDQHGQLPMAMSPSPTMEERFEYLLECGRRAGFDTFDAMAAQYYAHSFDPCSSLVMDQRLSRNQHLPVLLAAIRRDSARWGVWERRAYEEEALKTAEDICAMEFGEFCRGGAFDVDENSSNAVNLATIQQKLPTVWTLLSSLASAAPLQRQADRSHLVYSSIKQLYGMGDGVGGAMAVDN